jgi:comEA protein
MARPSPLLVAAVALFSAALLVPLGASADEKQEKAPAKVNLNTATAEELAKLPGVGEAIAARIIRHREKSGAFRSVDELLVVRGISRKKLEVLRPLVTVGEDSPERSEEKD